MRFGEDAASDRYRGLHIAADQMERALAIAPGTPLLFREEAADAMAGARETGCLALLGDLLGLDAFDRDVVIIALAPELDLRYERIYSFLQDDVTRRRPTVDLVLNLLCADAAERLGRHRRFLSKRLYCGITWSNSSPIPRKPHRRCSLTICDWTDRSCAGCSGRRGWMRRCRRSAR